RTARFAEMRDLVASNVDRRFRRYMGFRRLLGAVRVDYAARTLALGVGVEGRQPSFDLKALSGGERSVSTLCLVMALGQEGLCPPFHALDEFDVFMDAVNRRYALMFLLEFAHVFADRQFFVLTPQDLGALAQARENLQQQRGIRLSDGALRTIIMNPPQRGAGGFATPAAS
ncbi:hypothetical protein H632_c126p0, partial [Helicosporidium sp. ATCC 50920]